MEIQFSYLAIAISILRIYTMEIVWIYYEFSNAIANSIVYEFNDFFLCSVTVIFISMGKPVKITM
jgi:hypothetical protein